jgi:hypothetical protein
MLKIVPDPPHNHHSLEDTLIQAVDYALCAQTVCPSGDSAAAQITRVDPYDDDHA